MDQSTIPAKKIFVFIGLALITQILFAVPVFSHESTAQTAFGFSTVYWVFIGFFVLTTLFWLALIPPQSPLRTLIQWLSQWPGYVLILSGVSLIPVTLVTSNTNVLTVTFLNWLWFAWVIITYAKIAPSYHQTLKAAVIVIILLIPILLISAVGNRSVHPDESQWADRAAGIFYGGGVGTNLWIGFEDMKPIHPGLGWFPVIYGALLRYVSFSIETGRVWNFASGLVASVLLGTASGIMYGRREGIVTGLFAATGGELLIKQQYRSEYDFAMFIGIMLIWFALGQRSTHKRWHILVGLFAVLAMEVHAPGFAVIGGMSLYYFFAFIVAAIRAHGLPDLRPTIYFGIGALVGTGVYWVLNVIPVGGLSAFLEGLSNYGSRGGFYGLPSAGYTLRTVIFALTLTALVWRHREYDLRLLAMTGFVYIVLLQMGGWPGYLAAILFPFYILGFGAMIGTLFSRESGAYTLAAIAVLWVSILGLYPEISQGIGYIRAGQLPPFLYVEIRDELEPYIQPDDIVVSTHHLIWTFPEHNGLISFMTEVMLRNWPEYPTKVSIWEAIEPDVFIIVENQMPFEPGMQDYIREQDFKICAEFTHPQTLVTVYQRDC